MPFFRPDEYYRSVLDIDPAHLVREGYAIVLLDIDNTLVSRDTHVLTPEVKEWVAALGRVGLRACLLSNNWHKTVFAYAEELGVPIVYKAMKPFPFAFFRAFKKVRRQTGEKAIMIGDQITTDIWGAHVLRLGALLVMPQSSTDLWYTQIFRRWEGLVLRGLEPRGEQSLEGGGAGTGVCADTQEEAQGEPRGEQ